MAKIETKRREFIKYSTLGILGVVLAGGVIFSPYALKAENRLRTPGAVPEKEFLGLCIKVWTVFAGVSFSLNKIGRLSHGTRSKELLILTQ